MALDLSRRLKIGSFVLSFLIIGACLTTIASADTRYVHDILIVDVRDNMGKNYKVLTTVRTGDALEILEENKNFFKVKTRKGVVGYIARQYINKSLPKKTVISNLQSEAKKLNKKIALLQAEKDDFSSKFQAIDAQNKSYKQELSNTDTELKNTQKELENYAFKNQKLEDKLSELDKVTQEKSKLQTQINKLEPRIVALQERYDQALSNNKEASELIIERDDLQDRLISVQADMEFLREKHQRLIDDSKDMVSIIDERDALLAQDKVNAQEIKELRERNSKLEGTQMVYWFLAGAAVLLIGMLLGKATVRKKRAGLSGMMILF